METVHPILTFKFGTLLLFFTIKRIFTYSYTVFFDITTVRHFWSVCYMMSIKKSGDAFIPHIWQVKLSRLKTFSLNIRLISFYNRIHLFASRALKLLYVFLYSHAGIEPCISNLMVDVLHSTKRNPLDEWGIKSYILYSDFKSYYYSFLNGQRPWSSSQGVY